MAPTPPLYGENSVETFFGHEVLHRRSWKPGSPFPDEDQRATKKSYASVVMGHTKGIADVVSLKAMDDVEVLDGECVVDKMVRIR
ncbi:hypothetical protein F3Y22_tig00014175pilonHSYRG00001 [Hibiscus syriacus]|uniref:Uncharacterized protein n=1 Tax=Hibiscus syriacus TaxID=106335 RepID=A0A6A3C0F9_HIBSY|nr:hypothetical protein F3Y22_tig00014175pilonHSYRG00001 [Hibiscus syriacus]